MQRAMQTTVGMFRDHPDKDSIKFIVLPIVREGLITSNDVAIDVFTLMEKYGPGQEAAGGLTFDFSRLLVYGIP